MTNDEFRDIYKMLDGRYRAIAGASVGLKSLHAGGIIAFARHTRSVIEQWETEVARRAKAEAEHARRIEGCVRDDFGSDAYDKLMPDHEHSLDFDDIINPVR